VASGYAHGKQDLLVRLRRIEGQVRGLHRQVEEDTYCIDVLTQIAAVQSALRGVALGLVDDHLRHCVRDAVAADAEGGDAKVAEATAAIGRLLKG
jgi:CsoR family transcriptional regulator, copper-sensing transcriptional repressor